MKFIISLCFSVFVINFSFANGKFIKPVDSSNIIAKTIATKILNDGIALYQQGRNQEALIKFREASEKDPGNWLYPARIVVVILAFSTLANFLWRFRQTLD